MQDERLVSLPWVLEKYVPDMDNLPNLVLRLATEVQYMFRVRSCLYSTEWLLDCGISY